MSVSLPLLNVHNLSKSYGDFRAVKDVSFALHAGEFLAIIGPNGAGKTTTFNMVMGQIPISSGSIHFDGHDISGKPPREVWRLGVGRTFQIATVFATLTVAENLQVALSANDHQSFNFWSWRAAQSDARNDALLQQVGLYAQRDRACSALAYGDIKRLELAMALANSPKLLLMDEPTAGMAPDERAALMALTESIVHKTNMAVLFTEHDMDAVFAHADRILVLDQGKLIAQGTPAQVRANPLVQQVYLGSGATYQ